MDSPKLHRRPSRGVRPCPLRFCAAASARASTPPSRTVSAPAASGRSNRSTTGTRSRASSPASGSRPGRARSGATPTCCRPCRPTDADRGPGFTPLVPAPRLAARARGRRGLPQARPLEPDALVQGPRRRGRGREGDGVRARHALGDLDRQPRERGRGARGGDRDARGDLLPGRARGGEGRARRRSTAPRSTPSAGATTTARGSSASSPARSTGASSTSICAPTTPRARRRSRSRSSSSSAGRRPTPSSCRSAPGAMFTKVWHGFDQFRRLELSTGAGAEALRRPGRGLRAGRDARSPRTGG